MIYTDNDTDSEIEELEIKQILTNNKIDHDIIKLFEELHDRFPYLYSGTSIYLYNLIKFTKNTECNLYSINFYENYSDELHISYDIIQWFSRKKISNV